VTALSGYRLHLERHPLALALALPLPSPLRYLMTPVKEDSHKGHHCLHHPLKSPTGGLSTGPFRRSRLPLMAIAALVAAALASACGDSQDQAPGTTTPTAATSPTTTLSPEQQLLEQVVLRAEDLPAGLVQVDASTSTNEEIAAGQDDPEQELARLESMGRLLGYEVNFVPGSESPPERGMLAASSSASLYLTPEGASESFADDAQEARSADWPAAYPDLTDVEVKEVERPGLADEVVWIRITGLQSGEDSPMFIEDFVVLRQSRLRGFLRAISLVEASAGRDALLEDVADLAALHTQRIDAALQGS